MLSAIFEPQFNLKLRLTFFFMQVKDYAGRKQMGFGEMERWLAPILSYEREDDDVAA